MTPKQYYQNYLADDTIAPLNEELQKLISLEKPLHVFEFGCGTGKNLAGLGCVTCGLDVSFNNILHAHARNRIPFLIHGDEHHLGHLTGFDVVFTCSVLDHIELIGRIVAEFKRMGKTVFLAETNDVPGEFYYPHDYEALGFVRLDYFWSSPADKAIYYIWKWSRAIENAKEKSHDDLG